MNRYKSYNVTPKDVKKQWYIIDATDKPLGKVAAKAAYILRGKNKPIYTPYLDTGDNVIIINTTKAIVTGNKFTDKLYRRHSGYPGGLTSTPYGKMMERKPTFPMEAAIKGMLPKGPLGREMFRNVRVYKDDKYREIGVNPTAASI